MSEATEQKSTPIIQTPVVQIGSRMLRSPSHDSVTTDLSLFSVSSTTSNNNNDQIASKHNATNNQQRVINLRNYSDAHLPDRIPSPNPESRLLQIPRNRLVHVSLTKIEIHLKSFEIRCKDSSLTPTSLWY